MPLTPIDVQQKTFGPELRGYNMDEVDDFLDEVVATLKDYDQRLRDAQDRIRALEAELASRGEEETAISRALVAAQKQADAIIAEAQAEAETIRQSAQGEADRLLAERDAERMRLTQEIARMRATVADLKRRIVDLAAAAEANLDSMDAAIAEAATDIGSPEEPAAEELPVDDAAEIGDWGATSDDYAEPEAGWEEDAAEATEDEGGWGEHGDYGEPSPAEDSSEEPGGYYDNDEETAEGFTEEEPEASTDEYGESAEEDPSEEPVHEEETDFGTLADRMAREASRADIGDSSASGRRPWERGSV
jgi:cell division initiation protein